MSWKTTDSAKRGGINDFIRAPIAINSDNITGVDSEITDLSLQTLLGTYNDGTFGNTVNILADSLAYSDINNVADPLRFYSTIKDANGKNVIIIGRTNSGAPDVSSSMVFDDKENILFFADDISYSTFAGVSWGPARFLVNAPSAFTGDVIIDGSLDVQGDIYYHTEHEVSGNAYFSGEVLVRNNVGIGGNNVLATTNTSMSDPVWPSPDAKLDIRSYTTIGRSDPSGDNVTKQTDWKAANIYLDCGNQSATWSGTAPPSGIEWRPLAAIYDGNTNTIEASYNKLSAAIRFMPEDQYYIGGLGFYTTNDQSFNNQDPSTNGLYDISALRMKIDSEGDTTFNGGNVALNGGFLTRDTNYDSSGTDMPTGYLIGCVTGSPTGSYNKSYPIFALNDTSYNQESHISSVGFYGIGYTNLSNTGLLGNSGTTIADKWGMYIGAGGAIGCYIDGGEGGNTFLNATSNGGNVGIGTKDPTSKLHVNDGDIAINQDFTIATTGWSRAGDGQNDRRAMELLKDDMLSGSGRCIGLGYKTHTRDQSELWFHYTGSNNLDNYGSLGLFGYPNTLAFGADSTGGNVAIGYDISYDWSQFSGITLSVNGNTVSEGALQTKGGLSVYDGGAAVFQAWSGGSLLYGSLQAQGGGYSFAGSTSTYANTFLVARFNEVDMRVNTSVKLPTNTTLVADPATTSSDQSVATTNWTQNLVTTEGSNWEVASSSSTILTPKSPYTGVLASTINVTTLAATGINVTTLAADTVIATVSVTAPSFTATSDENKKEDIETISDATNKLASLRGVSFKLKDDKEKKTHYGVVAQELEKVFPDMVNGEEGNKSVAYMEIIGVLIETVKDLKQRIEVLEQSSNN